VHHDRVRPGHGRPQLVEVLLVVERVAAGPIDQPDVGEAHVAAVVADLRARVEQQVGDGGDRHARRHAVAALRQGGQAERYGGQAGGVHRAVPEAESPTRHTDLAQERAEGDDGPERHLAVLLALHRPGRGDEGAVRGEVDGEGLDGRGGQLAQRRRPGGVLGLPVALAEQVGGEVGVAHRVALDEVVVDQPAGDERVAQREDQRRVRAGPRGQPLDPGAGGEVVAQRGDADEPAAPSQVGRERLPRRVVPGPRRG
jgi:hypothetical protein